jgi:hypothetical protein
VVFDLNPHPDIAGHMNAIRQAFPQVFVFIVPDNNSQAAMGLMSRTCLSRSRFERAGKAIDHKCNFRFRFNSLQGISEDKRENEKKTLYPISFIVHLGFIGAGMSKKGTS